jgi:type I restriction enzyme S subunit
MKNLLTENIDIWTSVQIQKNGNGRGNGSANQSHYGIKKLRELILELAVRGKLVPQDPSDEPASVLLEKIAKEKARLIKEGKIKKEKPLSEISEEEKQFDLPQSWVCTRLGNFVYLEMGQSPPSLFYNQEHNGIPFFQGKSDFGDIFPTPRYWCTQPQKFAYSSDILLSVRAPVGPTNVSNIECCIGRGLAALRPLAGTNTNYLLYLMRAYQKKLEAFATGTTFAAVSKADVEELIISIPPCAEQHRIVAKVDELMKICDQLEQRQNDSNAVHQTLVETLLAALTSSASQTEFVEGWQRIASHFDILFTTEQSIDQLKQTILQLAVMGKLVPQDPTDEPASILLKKIADEKAQLVKKGKIKKGKPLPEIKEEEKPFNLPEEWKWTRLGPLSANIHYGYTASAEHENDGIRLLRITDIQNDSVNWETVPGCEIEEDKANDYLLENGDILIARTGGTIGKSYLVETIEVKAVFASYLIRVKRIEGTYPPFIKTYLGSQLYWQQLYENSMGTGQPNVNATSLKSLIFPLPPLVEQHRIVAKVDELMALCDKLKGRLQEAQTTQIQLADAIVEQAVI